MRKINKMDAIDEIMMVVENGDIQKANKMIKVVMDYMNEEKNANKNSGFIELRSHDQEQLFRTAPKNA